MPQLTRALDAWDGAGVPDEHVFAALAHGPRRTPAATGTARHRRAAAELLSAGVSQPADASTARATRPQTPAAWKPALIDLDARWNSTRDLAPPETRADLADARLPARTPSMRHVTPQGSVALCRPTAPSIGRRSCGPSRSARRSRCCASCSAIRSPTCLQPCPQTEQPADAIRDRAVLDLAARAHDRVVRPAAAGRRDQQPADGPRPRESSAAAHLQSYRRADRHDAYSVAVHDSRDLLGDEECVAVVRARGAVARRASR